MRLLRLSILLLLAGLPLRAEEPRLKATDELTAKVPVIFYDLRYGQLAPGIKECREVALVKPGPAADFRVFIRRRPYPYNLSHWLKVDYAGMTIHESDHVMMPKNVVKDACKAVLRLARNCEDCWTLYDRTGKAITVRQPPPGRESSLGTGVKRIPFAGGGPDSLPGSLDSKGREGLLLPVIFPEEFAAIAAPLPACREIAPVEPGARTSFEILIIPEGLEVRPGIKAWLILKNSGLTLLERYDETPLLEGIADACKEAAAWGRACPDCWVLYEQGHGQKTGQRAPRMEGPQ